MLDLGPYAGLELFGLLAQGTPGRVLLRPALARARGHMPAHSCRLRPFLGTLVARIGKHHRLLAVQQTVALGHIVHVGGGADDAVHQTRVGIDADVGLHAKVPLVALLGLVHLGVALATAILGGTWRGNQGGIDHSAGLEHQALGAQGGVDGAEHLLAQAVGFEQVTKAQDGGLVGQARGTGIEAGKLAVKRHVVQGFLHGRIR